MKQPIRATLLITPILLFAACGGSSSSTGDSGGAAGEAGMPSAGGSSVGSGGTSANSGGSSSSSGGSDASGDFRIQYREYQHKTGKRCQTDAPFKETSCMK